MRKGKIIRSGIRVDLPRCVGGAQTAVLPVHFLKILIFCVFGGNFAVVGICNHVKASKTLFKHIKLFGTQDFHTKTHKNA